MKWAADCVREDRRKIEPQHNHQFRTIGHEIDPAYQRAEFVCRQCPRLLVPKSVVKSSDLLMIRFRRIGVEEGRWFFRTVEEAAAHREGHSAS